MKSDIEIRQLHFHHTDGRSFLRMHRPDKFGDPLFDVRYSVKMANGLYFISYVIYPIYMGYFYYYYTIKYYILGTHHCVPST